MIITPPICAIDTETDGVHPDRKVWEVGMIRRDETGQKECEFFVDIDLSTADPFGLQIGGFYERHPLGRYLSGASDTHPDDLAEEHRPKSRHGAAIEVARWTHGAHLIGAVVNFDADVLANMLREWWLTPSWHYHLIEVEARATGYLAGRASLAGDLHTLGSEDDAANAVMAWQHANQLPWNSNDLSRACGIEPPPKEHRHQALADAYWALTLYDATGGQLEFLGPAPTGNTPLDPTNG